MPRRLARLLVVGLALASVPAAGQPETRCHPSYEGACVPIGRRDVDCPYFYAQGICDIRVVGPDVYGLDGNDDGLACERVSMERWRARQRN